MKREDPQEPTGDQCNASAKVFEDQERIGYAMWYPQMGGYCGKAVIVFFKPKENDEPGCFEAYVWHDGAFPFRGEDQGPNCIHHCDPEQFIDFGQKIQELMRKTP